MKTVVEPVVTDASETTPVESRPSAKFDLPSLTEAEPVAKTADGVDRENLARDIVALGMTSRPAPASHTAGKDDARLRSTEFSSPKEIGPRPTELRTVHRSSPRTNQVHSRPTRAFD